jgi:hypothetical protein
MKVNGGDYILRWYSGGIFFQNTSPVEKNEDYFILTWNSGIRTQSIVIATCKKLVYTRIRRQ